MTQSVVLTSYFSNKPHPNDPRDMDVIGREADGRVKQCDFSYIQKWHESVDRLDIDAFVFYDNLTQEFIDSHTTDRIRFIKSSPGVWSNNDGRFFCYLDFLRNHKYDNVFLTDGSDVIVVQDPSKIVEDFPDIDIFLCKDSIPLSAFGNFLNIHSHFGWKNYFWFDMQMKQRVDLINMGVIGGRYDTIVEFLEKFCNERNRMSTPEFNADMWLGQYVFRGLMSDKKLLIGEPFTSEFKKHQYDRKDVYFIHK